MLGTTTTTPTGGAPVLHTTAEAARLLGVTTDWLKREVTARAVPHTRLSIRNVRFSAANLAAIIADRAVPATTATRRFA